jgi:hypothetical protein
MMTYPDPVLLDTVHGDASGLVIPAHGEALRAAGAEFLTAAFRQFGSLGHDNRVARITRLQAFEGGSAGQKAALSVEYARPRPGLHTDLFVKFSRDFTDGFRDRRRQELEAEVRFAALSRLPGFPISVPSAYFADFNRASGTGLLITQRIAFGTGAIAPLLPKCMDHTLADPLIYYRAIVTTLARLAAGSQSGQLRRSVEEYFPFDPDLAAAEDPLPWTETQLRELVARYATFAQRCPDLLPANVRTPQFIGRMERDAVALLRHEASVKRFLNSDRRLIALCHYNANIDNAWFWRDAAGALQCGLLDWGRVRQMNVAYALWGSLCATTLSIWDQHLDELLALFVAELRRHGGALIDVAQLKLHLELYAAMMGLATLIEAPRVLLSRLPEAVSASGPLDPMLRRNDVARNFLHVFTSFLNLWQTHDFANSLDRILKHEQHRS